MRAEQMHGAGAGPVLLQRWARALCGAVSARGCMSCCPLPTRCQARPLLPARAQQCQQRAQRCVSGVSQTSPTSLAQVPGRTAGAARWRVGPLQRGSCCRGAPVPHACDCAAHHRCCCCRPATQPPAGPQARGAPGQVNRGGDGHLAAGAQHAFAAAPLAPTHLPTCPACLCTRSTTVMRRSTEWAACWTRRSGGCCRRGGRRGGARVGAAGHCRCTAPPFPLLL